MEKVELLRKASQELVAASYAMSDDPSLIFRPDMVQAVEIKAQELRDLAAELEAFAAELETA
jgi:hypothetical protein